MKDYIYENQDGKLVYDIEWDAGFFLRTFPHHNDDIDNNKNLLPLHMEMKFPM